jgi:hypothetical protein
LHNKDGKVIRIGRASNLVSRKAQHDKKYKFGSGSGYSSRIAHRTDGYILQRGLEDYVFNKFYDTSWKDNGGDNKIKAISDNNINKNIYRDTARYCLGSPTQWWK